MIARYGSHARSFHIAQRSAPTTSAALLCVGPAGPTEAMAVLASGSATMLGPWPKSAYETDSSSVTLKVACSTGLPKERTSKTGVQSARTASRVANAGSTNGYGSVAPFGSATSRFSPSMSMAHHIHNHAPALAGPTTAQGTKPNSRWVPPTLREAECPRKDASSASTKSPSSENQGSMSARKRDGGLMGRPRSAGEEQRLSRALRAEITEMREQKLRALRETQGTDAGDTGLTTARRTSPRTVVGLDGRTILRTHHPSCTASSPHLGHGEVRGSGPESHEPVEREISLEYADLLAFVAGEARTR